MSTNHHTPLSDPFAHRPSDFNSRFEELDEAIDKVPQGSSCNVTWPRRDALSGRTGRWTSSGLGTNEYYYTFPASEPSRVMYDGSAASVGTVGSLADHEWDYGDNDSLGYNTIYVRDDSGDPDSLDYALWEADWWGVDAVETAEGENGIFMVAMDSSTDEGMVISGIPRIHTGADAIVLRGTVQVSDGSTTGTLTWGMLDRVIADDTNPSKPSATTITSGGTVTMPAGGKPQRFAIQVAVTDLDAAIGEVFELMIYRDTSEDSMATDVLLSTNITMEFA